MTREEAIKVLQENLDILREYDIANSSVLRQLRQALEMAIQALEKENIYDDGEHYVTISKALYDKLNIDYESLSQEPCEDAISHDLILKRIEESVSKYSGQYTTDMLNMWGLFTQFIKEMPSVNPQPCKDAISRDAVIKTINNNTADERDGWLCIDNNLVHEIEKLPPVNPQYTGNEFFNFDAPMVKRSMEQDAVSRKAVLDETIRKNSIWNSITNSEGKNLEKIIFELPSVNPQPSEHFIDGVHAVGYREGYKDAQKQKSGKCKNCKYFEYDSVAKVDGIPLIVAHEICNKWGDGCKTSEDGYCYLFEPQESEDKE